MEFTALSIFHLMLLLIKQSTCSAGTHIVFTTEAFFIPINREWFSDFSTDDDLEYRASLLDMPDLPHWMHCRHPNGSNDAFLYGAAEKPGDVNIEIIALNKNNYKAAHKIVNFKVEHRGREAEHEVEMKFLNLNVEDMFEGDRISRLVEIYQRHLWRNVNSVYVTMIASAVDVGGRLPLNPKEKEGVVVRIGGTEDFSRDLQDLEREVMPLRNHFPCPRDFKRTSAERLFRPRDFISDWCSFYLIQKEKAEQPSHGWSDTVRYSSMSLNNSNYTPHPISLPRRDFLLDFIVCIIVPAITILFLLTSLTCIMCCHREGLSALHGCNIDSGLQLNQYSSIQQTNSQLHPLTNKQDSLPHLGSTPGSSLPRSRGGSPSSTLPKANTPRSSSRTGTLRSIMPPPPPYTPPGTTSRRSLSIPAPNH